MNRINHNSPLDQLPQPDRDRLRLWLEENTLEAVRQLAAQPRPAGLDLQTSLSSLQRFKRRHLFALAAVQNADFTEALAALPATPDHLHTANLALSNLLYQKTLESCTGQTLTPRELKQLTSAFHDITRALHHQDHIQQGWERVKLSQDAAARARLRTETNVIAAALKLAPRVKEQDLKKAEEQDDESTLLRYFLFNTAVGDERKLLHLLKNTEAGRRLLRDKHGDDPAAQAAALADLEKQAQAAEAENPVPVSPREPEPVEDPSQPCTTEKIPSPSEELSTEANVADSSDSPVPPETGSPDEPSIDPSAPPTPESLGITPGRFRNCVEIKLITAQGRRTRAECEREVLEEFQQHRTRQTQTKPHR